MNRRIFLYGALAAQAGRAATTGLLATPEQVASRKKLRVGIIGCGRMGQYFSEVYRRLPDTELSAIAEWNDDRRKAVGQRFGITALYKDVNAMLREQVPDIAAVITPTKFMKEAVIACAEAGVKGVSAAIALGTARQPAGRPPVERSHARVVAEPVSLARWGRHRQPAIGDRRRW